MRREPATRRRFVLAMGLAMASLALGACGSTDDGKPGYLTVAENALSPTTTAVGAAAPTTTLAPTSQTLLGVCPSPIVIQLDGPLDMWSLPYVALATADGTGNGVSYRSPLVDPYTRNATGVDIELRTAAAILPGSSVAEVVNGDPSAVLGVTDLTAVLPAKKDTPLIIAAPWGHGDLALRWTMDSAISSARTVGDLAGTVVANPEADAGAAAYLQASGLLPKKRDVDVVRPDATGEGTTGQATIIHALDDPATLPELIVNPGIERAQLLREVGWEPYVHVLVTRTSAVESRADCLKVLVKLVQRSTVRIGRESDRMLAHLDEVQRRLGTVLDRQRIAAQLAAAKRLGLLQVGNRDTPIAADVSEGRVLQVAKAQVVASRILKPRLRLPTDIKAIVSALVDRRFIDSSVTFDADVRSPT